jgi:hypothetical protein
MERLTERVRIEQSVRARACAGNGVGVRCPSSESNSTQLQRIQMPIFLHAGK